MPSRGSKPTAKAPKKAVAKKATVKKATVKKATDAKKVKKAAALPTKKAAPLEKAVAKKAAPAKRPVKKQAPVTRTAKKAAAPSKPPTNPTTKQARPAVKQMTKEASAPARRGKAPVLDKFLQEQVALLEEERRIYTEQAESLKAEADQLAQEMEPGDIQFDEESGEGATMNIDRERDLALSAQARAAVEEIEHALAKVRNGTYGVCEDCGQPIPKARLKALPYARLCVACKSGGLSRR
jgi:DnaK suppressor protein